MIQDRLAVGILDKKLSEHLQLDSDLTLEVAKKKICQCETVQAQQQVLEGAVSSSLEEVKQSHRRSQKKPGKVENHSISMLERILTKTNRISKAVHIVAKNP